MVNRLIIIASFILPLKAASQVLEYSTPEKLPTTINTEAEESMPLLSPDGKLLFFTRSLYPGNVGGKYSGHDIWISERFGKNWKKAENNRIELNSKNNNAVIGISGAGDVLYLMDASSSKKINGIYFTRRIGNTWTKPEFIPMPGVEGNGFVNFYVSPDFDVIFISMKGSDTRGEEDIYVSVKGSSGEWTSPKNLGASINTKGFEISPFLSADKKKLYFSSNGYPGMGDADIFVSERLYGSWEVWSVPQNLGNVINSEKFDAYFSIYGDSVCYFSSNRQSTTSNIFTAEVGRFTFSLLPGQRFLEEHEVQELIGKAVVPSILFDQGSAEMIPSQEELLFFISNKVVKNENINILFVSGNSKLASKRLNNLIDYFVSNGFDTKRLFSSELNKDLNKESENLIQLRFFLQ